MRDDMKAIVKYLGHWQMDIEQASFLQLQEAGCLQIIAAKTDSCNGTGTPSRTSSGDFQTLKISKTQLWLMTS